MSRVNLHKRSVQRQVEKYLLSCPIGYIVSSPNILFDLKLDDENHMNDDYVFKALFNVKDNKVLEKHGKTLDEIGFDRVFSRDGNRQTKLYKIKEYIYE